MGKYYFNNSNAIQIPDLRNSSGEILSVTIYGSHSMFNEEKNKFQMWTDFLNIDCIHGLCEYDTFG